MRIWTYLNNVVPATADESDKRRGEDPPTRIPFLDGYKHGDSLVLSEVAFETDKTEVTRIAADAIFKFLNADERPNGQRERSLSVGDLLCFAHPWVDAWLSVENVGWQVLLRPPDLTNVIKPRSVEIFRIQYGDIIGRRLSV